MSEFKRQTPDTAPGNYYVSVRRDDGDVRLIAGPYVNDHKGALEAVDEAIRIANKLDPKAWFYSYGTVRMAADYLEPGILNKLGKMAAPPAPQLELSGVAA